MATHRIERVEEQIKQEIADIIHNEVKDPRIGFITISEVKVSKDLRNALVFVSFLEDNKVKNDESLEGLNIAKGFIRRELGKRVTFKYLPELHFKLDETARHAAHINEILHSLNIQPEAADENKESEE